MQARIARLQQVRMAPSRQARVARVARLGLQQVRMAPSRQARVARIGLQQVKMAPSRQGWHCAFQVIQHSEDITCFTFVQAIRIRVRVRRSITCLAHSASQTKPRVQEGKACCYCVLDTRLGPRFVTGTTKLAVLSQEVLIPFWIHFVQSQALLSREK